MPYPLLIFIQTQIPALTSSLLNLARGTTSAKLTKDEGPLFLPWLKIAIKKDGFNPKA
jgi:hypothetical protein